MKKTDKGTFRITLDDVVQTSETPSRWDKDVLITFKEYDPNVFEALDFTEKELADFGYAVMARLYAFHKQGEI